MKATKKIIPALVMLLVSAVLLSTASYAWFSMNTTVTATGMNITAKSDATFLLIKAGAVADAAEIQAGKKITDNATNASNSLFPAAHNDIANITDADTVANWYYKTSTDPAVYGGDGKETAAVPLTAENFANYVLVNEFNLTVAIGSNQMANLKVGTCTISTVGDQAVKVLVATATGFEEFSDAGGDGTTVLQELLTDATVMQVKVYVYLDGEDADVFTNGIADLKNTSVEITFTGTVVPA